MRGEIDRINGIHKTKNQKEGGARKSSVAYPVHFVNPVWITLTTAQRNLADFSRIR
jgi:hypothetical protein